MTAFLTRKVGLSRMIPLGQSLPQDPIQTDFGLDFVSGQLEDLILIDITHRLGSYVQTDRTDQTRSHASHVVKSCTIVIIFVSGSYIHTYTNYWTVVQLGISGGSPIKLDRNRPKVSGLRTVAEIALFGI